MKPFDLKEFLCGAAVKWYGKERWKEAFEFWRWVRNNNYALWKKHSAQSDLNVFISGIMAVHLLNKYDIENKQEKMEL